MSPSTAAFVNDRSKFMQDADQLGAAFFFFSPPNVLPKIHLGKLVAKKHCLVDASGTARVIPYGTQAEYYARTLDALATYSSLLLVPAWIANNLRKSYTVAVQHHEYLIAEETAAFMDAPQLKQMRYNTNHADKHTTTEWWDGSNPVELMEVNTSWYKDANGRLFRTYDKASIDWMIQHWSFIVERAPDVRCVLIRSKADGRLLSFNIGSALTNRQFMSYTQRYLREPAAKGANFLGMRRLCCELPGTFGNIGSADTKEIKDWKDRLTRHTLTAYKVS